MRKRYLYQTDAIPSRTLRWMKRRERLRDEALAAAMATTKSFVVAESGDLSSYDHGPSSLQPPVPTSSGEAWISTPELSVDPAGSLRRFDSGLAPSSSSSSSTCAAESSLSEGSASLSQLSSGQCSDAEVENVDLSLNFGDDTFQDKCNDGEEKENSDQQSWSFYAEHEADLGAPLSPLADTTKGDALVMCLAFGLRHGLSWKGIEDLLQMINILFGQEVVKATKYFFQKYMEAGKGKLAFHLYCPYCERYLGIREEFLEAKQGCPCGQTLQNISKASTFFLSLDLAEQIQNLLRDKLFVEALHYRFERVKKKSENFEDIFDGEIYKELTQPGKILSSRYNMSYTFNTDGFPVGGKSGKQTCWPIYIQINELPPKVRSKYKLLAGLYVGKTDPSMTIFMYPFVEQANVLSTRGINWYLNGEKINSKFIPLCACVDTPARHKILNTTFFNGRYGCSLCYSMPMHTKGGYRYPLSTAFTRERTHQEILIDASKAHANRTLMRNKKKMRVRGVIGPTPLHNLFYFDLVKSVRPDTMHSILLGNAKHFVVILHAASAKPYYIGSDIRMGAISDRLLSIRPPSSLMRVPREFNSFKSWQAKEWRSWLLFYAVPCLMHIIPDEYVRLLNLLSSAVHIVLRESISESDLEIANILLLRYVFFFQEIFKVDEMVVNIHLLLHLKKSIEYLGPAWTNVAFSFEGCNKYLLELKKGASSIAQEIAKKYLTFQSLPLLCQKYASTEKALDFCERLSARPLLKSVDRVGDVVLLGKGKFLDLDHEQKLCLHALTLVEHQTILEFHRFIMKSIRFCVADYNRSTKTDDSYISVQNEFKAQIVKVLKCANGANESIYLLVKEILLHSEPLFNDEFGCHSSLHRILGEGQLKAITPEDISGQCVAMHLESGRFICDVPYGCYSDS